MKPITLNHDEHILKCIYENHITLDNYLEHAHLLRTLFPDEESYQTFISSYLTKFSSLLEKSFLRENQRLDAFSHPRFSQQKSHIHDFYEIKYQVKGTGTVMIGDETLFLRESDFCFIAPFIEHCSEIFDPDSYMINLVVIPRHVPQLIPRILQCPNFIESFFHGYEKKEPHSSFMHLHTDFDHEIEKLTTGIFQYFRENQTFTPIGDLNAEAALEKIFLLMLQKHAEQPCAPLNHARQNQQITRMMDYIQQHLNSVTFSELAQHFHYSQSYTSRFIKKYTNQSFTNILKVLRLKKAAELLLSSELTVDQLIQQIGYSGKTNFYNNFKKYYGVTPAEFRKSAPNRQ